MDPIKEAFLKIKEEINLIKEETKLLRKALLELYESQLKTPNQPIQTPTNPTNEFNQQTDKPTNQQENLTLEGLYVKNKAFSIGNEGVPTNRQTDKQTNQQTDFERANKILESLDSIRKEIRLKFKNLTNQEMVVFSTIYSLEDQGIEVTYKKVSEALHLSESSIRDYTNKLIIKGIPIAKVKLNNKMIILKISPDLKSIASLGAIYSLRNL
jgi:hypothetical protein